MTSSLSQCWPQRRHLWTYYPSSKSHYHSLHTISPPPSLRPRRPKKTLGFQDSPWKMPVGRGMVTLHWAIYSIVNCGATLWCKQLMLCDVYLSFISPTGLLFSFRTPLNNNYCYNDEWTDFLSEKYSSFLLF